MRLSPNYKVMSDKVKRTNLLRRIWGIILVCVLTVAGCEEPEPVVIYGVQLSANGVGIDACGGERRVEVTPFLSADDTWSVERTGTEEWFDCGIEGNAIVVRIEPNSEPALRAGAFNVVSAKMAFEPIRVSVTQEAAEEAVLRVDAPETYMFDSVASSYTFGVSANVEWDITTSAAWIALSREPEAERATIAVEANDGEQQRNAVVTITAGDKVATIAVVQDTHANNAYYRLVGKWEITASKWFYSPNGSLNSLDYAPNPSDYYLIFDLEAAEYGKTLKMRNFLYPGTELEVRYDAASGGFVIPFGWTVLSYDVFFYVTLVSTTQFSYASLEVDVLPNEDVTLLTPDLPTVDGFNYVGFGLWTYNDNGDKVAVGSNYRPTMFPMGDVQFKKSEVL